MSKAPFFDAMQNLIGICPPSESLLAMLTAEVHDPVENGPQGRGLRVRPPELFPEDAAPHADRPADPVDVGMAEEGGQNHKTRTKRRHF